MSKISMIYFSNTGNTEDMANIVAASAKEAGAEFDLVKAEDAKAEEVLAADVIVMGCCACGSEELDADFIEPLMESFAGKLTGKKVALFGSYGWGGGDFMETWVQRVQDLGAEVIGHVAGLEGPGEVEEELKQLGVAIANA